MWYNEAKEASDNISLKYKLTKESSNYSALNAKVYKAVISLSFYPYLLTSNKIFLDSNLTFLYFSVSPNFQGCGITLQKDFCNVSQSRLI